SDVRSSRWVEYEGIVVGVEQLEKRREAIPLDQAVFALGDEMDGEDLDWIAADRQRLTDALVGVDDRGEKQERPEIRTREGRPREGGPGKRRPVAGAEPCIVNEREGGEPAQISAYLRRRLADIPYELGAASRLIRPDFGRHIHAPVAHPVGQQNIAFVAAVL